LSEKAIHQKPDPKTIRLNYAVEESLSTFLRMSLAEKAAFSISEALGYHPTSSSVSRDGFATVNRQQV